MKITRRAFSLGLVSTAFSGMAMSYPKGAGQSSVPSYNQISGYGPLIKDKNGLLDLPRGFSYSVVSEFGDIMADGLPAPTAFDGMGCIPLEGSKVALVRNHELDPRRMKQEPMAGYKWEDPKVFDSINAGFTLPGGTSTVVYDMATGKRVDEYMSLIGTIRNCSGGITPWGSWLTCEENTATKDKGIGQDHGWVFEVPANHRGLIDPVPLKAMGRFNHEAAAVDPKTGIVYLTEDRGDSLFYRFIPNVPGELAKGGKLQALGVKNASNDSRNWESQDWKVGQSYEVFWIDLDEPESPKDDLRMQGHAKGATLFARGEGIHWGSNDTYFCCTNGGAMKLGQVMRYQPSAHEGTEKESASPGKIQLFMESDNPDWFNYGDNLVVAPNGHLLVCEDQYTDTVTNHLRGITPDGKIYTLGRITVQTEPAGACFSPDGKTMFVNLYHPGKTLAVTGPWDRFAV